MAEIATLCLLLRYHRELLLALKQEGHGAGKLNAPGGKQEEGESLEEGGVREILEEVGLEVHPWDLKKVAIIHFYFAGSPGPQVHVFLTDEWRGRPRGSREMVNPDWYNTTKLPWDNMWPADQHWMPAVLSGDKIRWDIYYSADGETVEKVVRHELNF